MQALRHSNAIEAPRCLWQHVTRVPDIAIPKTLKRVRMVLSAHRKIRTETHVEYIIRWIGLNQKRKERVMRLVRQLFDQRCVLCFDLFPKIRERGGIFS